MTKQEAETILSNAVVAEVRLARVARTRRPTEAETAEANRAYAQAAEAAEAFAGGLDTMRLTIDVDDGVWREAILRKIGDAGHAPSVMGDHYLCAFCNAGASLVRDNLSVTITGEILKRCPAYQPAAQLGRLGGKSTSKAKSAAARKNGKKGGRPRKHA